jgi:2-polyprenyl-3-methyl-5-hydroxy-6-metoxy-1,4-benzoquinol methylase
MPQSQVETFNQTGTDLHSQMASFAAPPRPNSGVRKRGIAMYDESADFTKHRTQMESMDATIAACGVFVDWPTATVCDVGRGGGLLASRAKRVHCADVLDQQARYGGEFVKLLAEKLDRHGHHLPVDRFAIDVTDATRLMYRDGWFDFICSVNAFEHIPDPNLALAEMA